MRLPDITKNSISSRVDYLSLISYMAQIDLNLNQKEEALILQMIEKFEIPSKYHSQIMDAKDFTDEQVQEIYGRLMEKKLHYSFFLDLLMMAMADGVIMEKERNMLAHIGRLMSIPSADFFNLLNFAQVSYQFKPDTVVDPMFDYVIDNLLLWARQKYVRLFRQTTFSANPTIDQLLKARL